MARSQDRSTQEVKIYCLEHEDRKAGGAVLLATRKGPICFTKYEDAEQATWDDKAAKKRGPFHKCSITEVIVTPEDTSQIDAYLFKRVQPRKMPAGATTLDALLDGWEFAVHKIGSTSVEPEEKHVNEDTPLDELRDTCERLGLKWHPRHKAETLQEMIDAEVALQK